MKIKCLNQHLNKEKWKITDNHIKRCSVLPSSKYKWKPMRLQSCGKAKPIKTDGEGVNSWKARILLAGRPKGTENTLAFSYKFKHVPTIGSRKPTCRCSPNRTKAKDLAKLCLQKPLCSGREPNTKDDSEGRMSARRWLGLFLALLSPQAQPTTAHGKDTAGSSQDKGEAAAPSAPRGPRQTCI